MKIKTYIFLLSIFLCYVLSKESLKSQTESSKIENKKNIEIDVIGEAYNTDSKPVVAISYGVASNAKYTINENNGVNYIKPEMVSSIPDVIPPPKPGPLEAVDEV